MKNFDQNKNNSQRIVIESDGYTLIEMLFVCAVMVLIAFMGMNANKSMRKHGIERTCATRLKQIGQLEETFRDIGDPGVNPDGSYGTFFELQNAGLIASTYVDADNEAHDVEPFIPYYAFEIVKSETDRELEPDRNNFLVIAWPIESSYKLRIFMMQEDGEVYFLSENTEGNRMVWQ